MKYALIIPDGCADEPQHRFEGRTPLEAARIPNMDAVARQGLVGRALDGSGRTAGRQRRGHDELVRL